MYKPTKLGPIPDDHFENEPAPVGVVYTRHSAAFDAAEKAWIENMRKIVAETRQSDTNRGQ